MRASLILCLAAIPVAFSALAGETRTATLDVSNMFCAGCPITVRKALERVPGVNSATVDFKTRRAVVAFDPTRTTPEALVKATAGAGFPSSVKEVR